MTELYKHYRPQEFEEMIGAEDSVCALENMVQNNSVPHTILFHGPSGCGKTTLARIVKDKLNCHRMDFREMNCSSFRGIDTIRELERSMRLSPTGGDVRVFLLDEFHQMSKDGQNAALKILEDTPNHVYFFLCTTEPEKLLKTIRTRCCEMTVRLLTYDEIKQLIENVCEAEGQVLEEDVVEEIVDNAGGSARTALVLLDKALSLSPEDQIKGVQQRAEETSEAIELCRALMKNTSWVRVAKILKNLKGDPESIRYAVMGYANSVLMKKANDRARDILVAFEHNFYDSKKFGLTLACYEVIND